MKSSNVTKYIKNKNFKCNLPLAIRKQTSNTYSLHSNFILCIQVLFSAFKLYSLHSSFIQIPIKVQATTSEKLTFGQNHFKDIKII